MLQLEDVEFSNILITDLEFFNDGDTDNLLISDVISEFDAWINENSLDTIMADGGGQEFYNYMLYFYKYKTLLYEDFSDNPNITELRNYVDLLVFALLKRIGFYESFGFNDETINEIDDEILLFLVKFKVDNENMVSLALLNELIKRTKYRDFNFNFNGKLHTIVASSYDSAKDLDVLFNSLRNLTDLDKIIDKLEITLYDVYISYKKGYVHELFCEEDLENVEEITSTLNVVQSFKCINVSDDAQVDISVFQCLDILENSKKLLS